MSGCSGSKNNGARRPCLVNPLIGGEYAVTNHTPVEDLGCITARLFIRAVHEACLVEQIIDNYLKICNEYGVRLGVRPRKLADIDLRRVEFELLAFGGYVLTGSLWRNLGVFEKKYSQPGHDRRYLDYFAAELADYLGILGADQLKEVVVAQIVPEITFSEGLPLDVFRRFDRKDSSSGHAPTTVVLLRSLQNGFSCIDYHQELAV